LPGNRVKTDRRDAEKLARCHRANASRFNEGAIGRELLGFIWAIGVKTETKQQAQATAA
jgi:hypothetical protein